MNRNTAFILLLCGLTSLTVSATGDPVQGEQLFKANCKACHHLEMRLVGPALKDVDQRHDEDWLIRFIRSSESVIASGDSTAINLFNTYNKVPMPDQTLTDEEILSVLAYIKEAGKADPSAGSIVRPEVARSDIRPLKFSDYRFWILYTVTVILVMVAVYYKAEMASLEKKVNQTGATDHQQSE